MAESNQDDTIILLIVAAVGLFFISRSRLYSGVTVGAPGLGSIYIPTAPGGAVGSLNLASLLTLFKGVNPGTSPANVGLGNPVPAMPPVDELTGLIDPSTILPSMGSLSGSYDPTASLDTGVALPDLGGAVLSAVPSPDVAGFGGGP